MRLVSTLWKASLIILICLDQTNGLPDTFVRYFEEFCKPIFKLIVKTVYQIVFEPHVKKIVIWLVNQTIGVADLVASHVRGFTEELYYAASSVALHVYESVIWLRNQTIGVAEKFVNNLLAALSHVQNFTEVTVKSFVKTSSNTTWPAMKFVRDPPYQKYIVIREKELKELKKLFDGFLNHDNRVNGVYLFGVPGSGKTELARQYANFAYKKHGVSTVITLNAQGSNVFRKNLLDVLIQTKIPELTIEQIDLMRQWKLSDLMNELRQLLRKRPGWLLIVDNIYDPNITQKDFYKELPRPGTDQWGTGMMLVTTQIHLHDSNSAYVRIKHTNDGLTLDDARNFLANEIELIRYKYL